MLLDVVREGGRVRFRYRRVGEVVDMVLAGHVFEYGRLHRDDAFALVDDLCQCVRTAIDG